jgi:hypothetical protein
LKHPLNKYSLTNLSFDLRIGVSKILSWELLKWSYTLSLYGVMSLTRLLELLWMPPVDVGIYALRRCFLGQAKME